MLKNPNWKPAKEIKVPLEDWQKLLIKAANILKNDGWTRSVLYDHRSGAYCMIGAIQLAAFNTPIASDLLCEEDFAPYRTYHRVTDEQMNVYLKAVTAVVEKISTTDIPNWNDSECKTKKEAMAKLKEAANVKKS